jgi:hypothetical protein
MVKWFVFSLLLLKALCFSELDPRYTVKFGSDSADIKVVEHFSFSCPLCIDLFNKDFELLKKKYFSEERVSWSYSVTPLDLASLQAMVCLEKLNTEEKKIFLESIFKELPGVPSDMIGELMKHAMSTLGKPVPDLNDKKFLEKTQAFEDAYNYMKHKVKIKGVPTLEINGCVFDEEPSFEFVSLKLDTFLTRR